MESIPHWENNTSLQSGLYFRNARLVLYHLIFSPLLSNRYPKFSPFASLSFHSLIPKIVSLLEIMPFQDCYFESYTFLNSCLWLVPWSFRSFCLFVFCFVFLFLQCFRAEEGLSLSGDDNRWILSFILPSLFLFFHAVFIGLL